MLYDKVFQALNKAKVKYVIVGGAAVFLYGYARYTHDLDLIIQLEEENLKKTYGAFAGINFVPKVPVTKDQFADKKQRALWKKEKGMIVFSFVNKNPPFDLVDVFVDEPIKFDSVYAKRKIIKSGDLTLPIIDIDQLILLKKKASRPKDLDDIVQLKEIKRLKKNDKKSAN